MMATIVEYGSIFYDPSAVTKGFVASGATATGPMNWQPNTTIQWPDSGNSLSWEPEPFIAYSRGKPEQKEVGLVGDCVIDIRKQMAELMAENLDELIMGEKKEKKMPKNDERTVYNVFVVDPEDDGAVIAKLENVIAKSAEAAKLKAVLQLAENEDKLAKDLEDYDLLVEDVADYGSIRPK